MKMPKIQMKLFLPSHDAGAEQETISTDKIQSLEWLLSLFLISIVVFRFQKPFRVTSNPINMLLGLS
jgi:hypothetical protein